MIKQEILLFFIVEYSQLPVKEDRKCTKTMVLRTPMPR